MIKATPRKTLAVFVAAVVVTAGCSSWGAPRNRLWKGDAIEVSAEELRIQIRALAAPFSGILEEAADQIIASSDEPRVKHDALLFKINAIPAMQTALFQRDPLAALYDTWAFIWQMRGFWDGGFGGQAQPAEALRAGHEATDRMEQYLEHVAAQAIEGDDAMAATRRAVQDWASENPMTRGFRSRPSATVDLAHFMGESNQGLLRTAAALRENVDDLTSRIDVYVAFLPKQARWHTELLLAQTTGTLGLDQLPGQMASMVEYFGAVSRTVEEVPGLVQGERVAILEALRQERMAALAMLSDELSQTHAFIRAERQAILTEDLDEQRVATLDALTAERVAVMEALRSERIETLKELERLTDDFNATALRTVDHIFLRLVQVMLGVIFLVFLLSTIAYWLVSRRRAF